MPFVTAHGIRLAYELSGPAGGPACVLIHGWTGSIVEWAAVIRPLNDLGWRTLAIDGPGHGRSEAPAAREMYTMHALADLHHEVARVLGYSPAVVMGFSMGGAIAEEYALRHPRSVRGLVLLGSAGGDWIDEEAQAEIDEALPVAFSERMGAVWERRARRLYPEELDRMSVEERARRREAFAATSAEGYVYTLHGLQEKRTTLGALTKLAQPTLIVHGAADDASIIEAARRLHVAIPGSCYVVVPDAGHFAQDDNPDALNHGLADFLWGARAPDIYAAATYLKSLPYIAGDAIAAVGFSHGGGTVLWAATAAGGYPSTPVRAFVAFYPPCGGGLGAYRGSVPVLLLLGAKDDWARPGPCQAWAEEARQAGQLVTAIVYPGARHAFDARGIQGVVTVPDARGGAGATIAYDPQAHADAEKQVRELLRSQLLR